MTYKCEYCGNSFKRENTLAVHLCEQKRRRMQKSDRHVVAGFDIYNTWYKISLGAKKNKTYEEFCSSKYYSAFVRTGKYIIDVKVQSPELFVKWLTENKIRLDDWPKDSTYTKYLGTLSKQETPERAVEKFVIVASEWARTRNDEWFNIWKNASPNVIIEYVRAGKISPWVIFGSDAAQTWLDGIPDEMVYDLVKFIDVDYWKRKINLHRKDVEWINEVIG